MLNAVPQNPTVPKYVAAERALRDAIETGHYTPGDQLPAQEDLASQLGIAMLTLRRAVDGLVSEGLLERRPRRGTFVTHRARAPHLCHMVFRIPDIHAHTSPWLAFEAIRQAAGPERQVRLMALPTPLPPATQVAAELRAMNVGAVGLQNFRNFDLAFVRTLSELVPCVLIAKNLPGVRLPCAKPNMAEAARLAVDYLARHGRRRIAVLLINVQHEMHNELAHAAEAEMVRHGLPVDRGLWYEISEDPDNPPDNTALSCRWVRETLQSGHEPDGIILMDARADEVLEGLEQRGKRVGRDIDVVNIIGGPVTRPPSRPTIDLGFKETAEEGARMLVDLVAGKRGVPVAPVRLATPRLIEPAAENGERG